MFLILCTNQNSQNLKMFITMFKILLIKTSKTVKCKFTLYGSREISRDQKGGLKGSLAFMQHFKFTNW